MDRSVESRTTLSRGDAREAVRWESARLLLRQPAWDDVDAVFRIHSDPRTYAHFPEGVMARREDAVAVVRDWRAHWERNRFGYAVVEPRRAASDQADSGRAALGFAGLKRQAVLGHDVLNLYYRFDPAYWGCGYATEAAEVLVTWAGATWPDVPVLARVALNNPASIRVAERVGLIQIAETDPDDPVPHVLLLSRLW